MSDAKYAQNVCHACSLRKKACNKVLPACGFCASRRLLCRYDISTSKNKGQRRHNPGRHFVPLQSPPPSGVSGQTKTARPRLPSPKSQQDYPPLHHSSFFVFPKSLEETLNQLAQHFSERSKLTYNNIIDRYFQTFPSWLPLVSPDSFRQEASRYQAGCVPAADFTVLLLAMMLNIFPVLDSSVRPTQSSQEFLYRTTKAAFAQAQASICTSLRLVQAGLILALCEYTCVRADAAYISITTCASLARVARIEVKAVRSTRLAKKPGQSLIEELEREKVTWTIAMVERYELVLCEMDQRDLKPQTECPNQRSRLPSNLKLTAGPDFKLGPNFLILSQDNLSNLEAADSDLFALQAHAVSLLDRLLLVMHKPADKKESKLADLAELDSEIRSLLEVVMGEVGWRLTLFCSLVALCVRLLFLLHESVLDTLQHSESEIDHQRRELAWIGLDMVCQMTLDVAQCYGEAKTQIAMPICCFYNLQTARKYLQERNKFAKDDARSRDIDSLLQAEEMYREMWVF